MNFHLFEQLVFSGKSAIEKNGLVVACRGLPWRYLPCGVKQKHRLSSCQDESGGLANLQLKHRLSSCQDESGGLANLQAETQIEFLSGRERRSGQFTSRNTDWVPVRTRVAVWPIYSWNTDWVPVRTRVAVWPIYKQKHRLSSCQDESGGLANLQAETQIEFLSGRERRSGQFTSRNTDWVPVRTRVAVWPIYSWNTDWVPVRTRVAVWPIYSWNTDWVPVRTRVAVWPIYKQKHRLSSCQDESGGLANLQLKRTSTPTKSTLWKWCGRNFRFYVFCY